MSRAKGLEKTRKWVEVYDGYNLVKDYRKKLATDRMQTIDDLQKLGVTVTPEQIARKKQEVWAYQQQQRHKKRNAAPSAELSKQNPHFFMRTRATHFSI